MANDIKVTYKYLYRKPVRMNTNMKELLSQVLYNRAEFIQKWLNTDEVYDPLNDFKVTRLQLDQNKKIKIIELQEMENLIYERP